MKFSNKMIGILGGASYPSTILYYETLNQLYHKKFKKNHSCPIVLYSIDYENIKSNYKNGWEVVSALLREELLQLISFNPSCIIIANNTLHKAFDLIKDELKTEIPFFLTIDLTKEYSIKNGYKNVLLLGTKFTMEDNYFKQPLIDAGINVSIPDEQERNMIQEIQVQLSSGNPVVENQLEYFKALNEKYAHLDAFILGCTEIPLIYNQLNTTINIIDTLKLQCDKAMSIFK